MPKFADEKKTGAISSRSWRSTEPALQPWVLDAVAAMGFDKMTPVQASTLPLFMGNKDVVVEAVTGSGKTLSFLIPVVERILRLGVPTKRHHVAAILIAPTRELAIQIVNVLKSLIFFHAPSAAALQAAEKIEDDDEEDNGDDVEKEHEPVDYSNSPRVVPQLLVSGTTSHRDNIQYFLDNSPNVLVGTPGRLLEVLSSPRVHCPQSSFEVLVLDEADRLLDLGFKDDLQRILGKLPKQRRTGLFSASVSEALDQLIRVGLRNPMRIAVKVKSNSGKHDQRTPTSLQMAYVVSNSSHKLPILFQILKTLRPTPSKTIIYLSTCAGVDYFQHVLTPLLAELPEKFMLFPLHGKHTPEVRQKNFTRFSDAMVPSVLLTTDVAARGLDIPQVDLVAQIDPPQDPKVFLHRAGRAGRAGRKGLAIIFLRPGREEGYVPFLEVRQTPVTPLELPGIGIDAEEAVKFSSAVREIVKKDRALHEKAQQGFVSWVQAYRKHQTRSIFQLADLDWADLARAWGLLKMPRMPELKGWDGDPTLGLDIDFETFGFEDKQREKKRLADLQAKRDNAGEEKGPFTAKRAWSDAIGQKNEREKRRTKKQTKKERERWEQMTPQEREREMELPALIELAKKQNLQENEEFQGFDD